MAFSPRVQPYAINGSGDSTSGLADDISTRSLSTVRVGADAGKINTGIANAFIGYQSAYAMQDGSYMTCIGYQSGFSGTTNQQSVFIGAFSGGQTNFGNETVYVGYKAGELSQYSTQSVGIGAYSLRENTSGNAVVAVGYRAGEKSLDGGYNTFIGAQSGQDNRSGFYNTMGGFSSGRSSFLGNYNTYFGAFAGYSNSYGSGNTFIGYSSGATLTYGDCNIGIGAFSFGGSSSSSSNQNHTSNSAFNIVIGNQTECYNNYSVLIGNELYNDQNNSILIGNLNNNKSKNTVILGSNINIEGIQSFTDAFDYNLCNLIISDAKIKYNISDIEYSNLLIYASLDTNCNLITNINGPNDLISTVYTTLADNQYSYTSNIDINNYIVSQGYNYFNYQGFSLPVNQYIYTDGDEYYFNVYILMHGNSITDSGPYDYYPSRNVNVIANQIKFNVFSKNYPQNGSFGFNSNLVSYLEWDPYAGIFSANNIPFTFELYFYANDLSSDKILFGGNKTLPDGTLPQNGWYVRYVSSKNYIGIYNNTNYSYDNPFLHTNVNFLSNTWYNIAFTNNNYTYTLFIDGKIQQQQYDNLLNYDLSASFYLGWDGNIYSQNISWDGYIQEFRITFNICRYFVNYTLLNYPFQDNSQYGAISSATNTIGISASDLLNNYIAFAYNDKQNIQFGTNNDINYLIYNNYLYIENRGNEYPILTTSNIIIINYYYINSPANSNILYVPIYLPKTLSYPIYANLINNSISNLNIADSVNLNSNLNIKSYQSGISNINNIYIINSNIQIYKNPFYGSIYDNGNYFIYTPYIECITTISDFLYYSPYYNYQCTAIDASDSLNLLYVPINLINIANTETQLNINYVNNFKLFHSDTVYFNDKLYINSNIFNLFKYDINTINKVTISNLNCNTLKLYNKTNQVTDIYNSSINDILSNNIYLLNVNSNNDITVTSHNSLKIDIYNSIVAANNGITQSGNGPPHINAGGNGEQNNWGFTFTTLNGYGSTGPTNQYPSLGSNSNITVLQSGIQEWIVPISGTYQIIAAGASSYGQSAEWINTGAIVYTTYHFNKNDKIDILVGQLPTDIGSGGGGTYIVDNSNSNVPVPILIAGGGGGNKGQWYLLPGSAVDRLTFIADGGLGGWNGWGWGSGGGGFAAGTSGNGQDVYYSQTETAQSYLNGGVGFLGGGFGGGGGNDGPGGGGGGGGYNGGSGAGIQNSPGNAGTSYCIGSKYASLYTNSINEQINGNNAGSGFVNIELLISDDNKGNQTIFTNVFTTCDAKYQNGPSYDMIINYYNNSNKSYIPNPKPLPYPLYPSNAPDPSYTNGVQQWIAPYTGNYTIYAAGASGGDGIDNTNNAALQINGGPGIFVYTIVNITAGDIILILVGQNGELQTTGSTFSVGGGGGTFVYNLTKNKLLLCAGGGGGGDSAVGNIGNQAHVGEPGQFTTYTDDPMNGTLGGINGQGGGGWGTGGADGGGGAGFYGDGGYSGFPYTYSQNIQSYLLPGNPPPNNNTYNCGGGFGGGGSADTYWNSGNTPNGGGGGGYSGGWCGGAKGGGGGGGSYDINTGGEANICFLNSITTELGTYEFPRIKDGYSGCNDGLVVIQYFINISPTSNLLYIPIEVSLNTIPKSSTSEFPDPSIIIPSNNLLINKFLNGNYTNYVIGNLWSSIDNTILNRSIINITTNPINGFIINSNNYIINSNLYTFINNFNCNDIPNLRYVSYNSSNIQNDQMTIQFIDPVTNIVSPNYEILIKNYILRSDAININITSAFDYQRNITNQLNISSGYLEDYFIVSQLNLLLNPLNPDLILDRYNNDYSNDFELFISPQPFISPTIDLQLQLIYNGGIFDNIPYIYYIVNKQFLYLYNTVPNIAQIVQDIFDLQNIQVDPTIIQTLLNLIFPLSSNITHTQVFTILNSLTNVVNLQIIYHNLIKQINPAFSQFDINSLNYTDLSNIIEYFYQFNMLSQFTILINTLNSIIPNFTIDVIYNIAYYIYEFNFIDYGSLLYYNPNLTYEECGEIYNSFIAFSYDTTHTYQIKIEYYFEILYFLNNPFITVSQLYEITTNLLSTLMAFNNFIALVTSINPTINIPELITNFSNIRFNLSIIPTFANIISLNPNITYLQIENIIEKLGNLQQSRLITQLFANSNYLMVVSFKTFYQMNAIITEILQINTLQSYLNTINNMSFFSYNDNIIIYLSQSLFYNILYINQLSGSNNVSIQTLYTIFDGFKFNNFSSLLNIISQEYQSLINYFVNFMTFIIPPEGITLSQFYNVENPSNPTFGIINILNVIQPQFTMLIEYITSISTINNNTIIQLIGNILNQFIPIILENSELLQTIQSFLNTLNTLLPNINLLDISNIFINITNIITIQNNFKNYIYSINPSLSTSELLNLIKDPALSTIVANNPILSGLALEPSDFNQFGITNYDVIFYILLGLFEELYLSGQINLIQSLVYILITIVPTINILDFQVCFCIIIYYSETDFVNFLQEFVNSELNYNQCDEIYQIFLAIYNQNQDITTNIVFIFFSILNIISPSTNVVQIEKIILLVQAYAINIEQYEAILFAINPSLTQDNINDLLSNESLASNTELILTFLNILTNIKSNISLNEINQILIHMIGSQNYSSGPPYADGLVYQIQLLYAAIKSFNPSFTNDQFINVLQYLEQILNSLLPLSSIQAFISIFLTLLGSTTNNSTINITPPIFNQLYQIVKIASALFINLINYATNLYSINQDTLFSDISYIAQFTSLFTNLILVFTDLASIIDQCFNSTFELQNAIIEFYNIGFSQENIALFTNIIAQVNTDFYPSGSNLDYIFNISTYITNITSIKIVQATNISPAIIDLISLLNIVNNNLLSNSNYNIPFIEQLAIINNEIDTDTNPINYILQIIDIVIPEIQLLTLIEEVTQPINFYSMTTPIISSDLITTQQQIAPIIIDTEVMKSSTLLPMLNVLNNININPYNCNVATLNNYNNLIPNLIFYYTGDVNNNSQLYGFFQNVATGESVSKITYSNIINNEVVYQNFATNNNNIDTYAFYIATNQYTVTPYLATVQFNLCNTGSIINKDQYIFKYSSNDILSSNIIDSNYLRYDNGIINILSSYNINLNSNIYIPESSIQYVFTSNIINDYQMFIDGPIFSTEFNTYIYPNNNPNNLNSKIINTISYSNLFNSFNYGFLNSFSNHYEIEYKPYFISNVYDPMLSNMVMMSNMMMPQYYITNIDEMMNMGMMMEGMMGGMTGDYSNLVANFVDDYDPMFPAPYPIYNNENNENAVYAANEYRYNNLIYYIGTPTSNSIINNEVNLEISFGFNYNYAFSYEPFARDTFYFNFGIYGSNNTSLISFDIYDDHIIYNKTSNYNYNSDYNNIINFYNVDIENNNNMSLYINNYNILLNQNINSVNFPLSNIEYIMISIDKYNYCNLKNFYNHNDIIYTSNNLQFKYCTINYTNVMHFSNFNIQQKLQTYNNYENFCSGNNDTIKGIDNILFGDYLNIEGNDSIIIGNNIGNLNTQISKSILITNHSLNNSNVNFKIENFIIIGINNFIEYIDINKNLAYNNLLDNYPIIIGNNINNTDFYINIGNTFLKTNYPNTEQIYLGLNNEPVLLGYNNNILNPSLNCNLNLINNNYGLYVNSGIYNNGDIITNNINLQNNNINNLNNIQVIGYSSELISKYSIVRYAIDYINDALRYQGYLKNNKWPYATASNILYINSVKNAYDSNIIGVVDSYTIFANSNQTFDSSILYKYNIIVKGIAEVYISEDTIVNPGDYLVTTNTAYNVNLLWDINNINSANIDNNVNIKYTFARSIEYWNKNVQSNLPYIIPNILERLINYNISIPNSVESNQSLQTFTTTSLIYPNINSSNLNYYIFDSNINPKNIISQNNAVYVDINIYSHNLNILNQINNITNIDNSTYYHLYDNNGEYYQFTIRNVLIETIYNNYINLNIDNNNNNNNTIYNNSSNNIYIANLLLNINTNYIDKGDYFNFSKISNTVTGGYIYNGINQNYISLSCNLTINAQLNITNINICYGTIMGKLLNNEYYYDTSINTTYKLSPNLYGNLHVYTHNPNLYNPSIFGFQLYDNFGIAYSNVYTQIPWTNTDNLNIELIDYSNIVPSILQNINIDSMKTGDYFMFENQDIINTNGFLIPYIYLNSTIINKNNYYNYYINNSYSNVAYSSADILVNSQAIYNSLKNTSNYNSNNLIITNDTYGGYYYSYVLSNVSWNNTDSFNISFFDNGNILPVLRCINSTSINANNYFSFINLSAPPINGILNAKYIYLSDTSNVYTQLSTDCNSYTLNYAGINKYNYEYIQNTEIIQPNCYGNIFISTYNFEAIASLANTSNYNPANLIKNTVFFTNDLIRQQQVLYTYTLSNIPWKYTNNQNMILTDYSNIMPVLRNINYYTDYFMILDSLDTQYSYKNGINISYNYVNDYEIGTNTYNINYIGITTQPYVTTYNITLGALKYVNNSVTHVSGYQSNVRIKCLLN